MSTNVTVPIVPKPAVAVTPTSSLAARVVASQVATATPGMPSRPASLKSGNTNKLEDVMRCVLYAETSARKTSTAAMFAGADDSRIILTRPEDQLKTLEGMGFEYQKCEDAAAFNYALRYPEALWPDWAAKPDPDRKRTIIIDDLTKGVAMLVDGNAAKDNRAAYRDAQADLDKGIQSLMKKPYNLILIATAKVKDNPVTNEETIFPELPPSMMNYVLAEFTGVFYVKVGLPNAPWKMLTDRDTFAYEDTDPVTGKVRSYRRSIFAKSKSSLLSLGRGPNPNAIQREEPLDLKLYWQKVKAAASVTK